MGGGAGKNQYKFFLLELFSKQYELSQIRHGQSILLMKRPEEQPAKEQAK